MSLFPAFLKLSGREVLLVGGGRVAAASSSGLLGAGARRADGVPRIWRSLAPGVRLIRRRFEARDLDGCWFVVSAAPAEVNR